MFLNLGFFLCRYWRRRQCHALCITVNEHFQIRPSLHHLQYCWGVFFGGGGFFFFFCCFCVFFFFFFSCFLLGSFLFYFSVIYLLLDTKNKQKNNHFRQTFSFLNNCQQMTLFLRLKIIHKFLYQFICSLIV